MNAKVNKLNEITMLGKQRAERAIVSAIGNEVILRVKSKFRTAEEQEERLCQFLSYPLELADWKKTSAVIENALRIIVRMYADPDYNDKQIDADCLELRQLQLAERAKQ